MCRLMKVCGLHGTHPGLTVLSLLNYTRIENAHKVCKKTFIFYYVAVICTTTGGTTHTGGCVGRCDQTGNPPELSTIFKMLHILQAHVLPHKKTKRETSDA